MIKYNYWAQGTTDPTLLMHPVFTEQCSKWERQWHRWLRQAQPWRQHLWQLARHR